MGFDKNKSKISIAIATNKLIDFPSDDCYCPIFVGAAVNKYSKEISDNYILDNSGINISDKNPYCSELTALYWLLNNTQCDYYGLVHYRRYFQGKKRKTIASQNDVCEWLKESDIILPKKRYYFTEKVITHYENTVSKNHFKYVRSAIEKISPEYLDAFDVHINKHSQHIWNMLIMKDEICRDYINWLFSILFEVEKDLDFSQMSPFQARSMGRISERLLDVYLLKNSLNYIEKKVYEVDGKNTIKKAFAYFKAKFLGKKYEKSF